jgi:hypothetical protein
MGHRSLQQGMAQPLAAFVLGYEKTRDLPKALIQRVILLQRARHGAVVFQRGT